MDIDFANIYHFLFETTSGVGILVAAMLVVSVLVAALLEIKTLKTRPANEAHDEDEWDFFSSQDDANESN